MPATVQIISYHGTTGTTETQVDGSNTRFKQADNDTVDAVNPIPIPGAGSNYSYIKQLRLKATTTPANTLSNIKAYMDGANGFGTGVSLNGKTNASYVDPGAQGTTALSGTSDMFGYTSGSPLSITGSLNNPSTGGFGDYLEIQMAVTTTATQGNTGAETLTMTYDET